MAESPPQENRSHSTPVFLDLFAGCGGLSLGLMCSGWQGLLAVERDPWAFETLKSNLIDSKSSRKFVWPTWFPQKPCSVEAFISNHKDQIKRLKGSIELIAGGPPCQGFSVAGKRDPTDPRNNMFDFYLKIVEEIAPPFLLLENVRGIKHSRKTDHKNSNEADELRTVVKTFAEYITESLATLGYKVFADMVNASRFGVPQRRERYIVIAVRSDLVGDKKLDPFALMESDRSAFLTSRGLPLDLPVTVREAISDLETAEKRLVDCPDTKGFKQIEYGVPTTTYQCVLHGKMNGAAPNSLRLANHSTETATRFAEILAVSSRGVRLPKDLRERLQLKKTCIIPLDGDAPAPTLTTLPDDFLHYSEPRILTVREYARLQSFPDYFDFKGNYTTGGDRRTREVPRYTQVGNAVPPLLAEMLGIVLKRLDAELRQIPRVPEAS